MLNTSFYVQVAVPVPLYNIFDYIVPKHISAEILKPGIRVQVPFGHKTLIGIILGVSTNSEFDTSRIKAIKQYLDTDPVFDSHLLKLINWTASYYHHPIGEVCHSALPALLRAGKPAKIKLEKVWRLTTNHQDLANTLQKAPRQMNLYQRFKQNPLGLTQSQLRDHDPSWSTTLNALVKKQLLEEIPTNTITDTSLSANTNIEKPLKLNPEQSKVFTAVLESYGQFQTHLLFGETGSGKTEVYLQLIDHSIKRNRQVLVLVPEIGLTPQLIQRFRKRFANKLAISHSKLNNSERFLAWHDAKNKHSQVILGTRSAVFLPCPKLDLIIIDEEHDLSFKQQDGLRYNARDVAIRRAQMLNIPILLGSATPSLESMHNSINNKFKLQRLSKRAGSSQKPSIQLIDIRAQTLQQGLSSSLISAIKSTIAKQQQILLFLNRRGFTPTLMCHNCGWVASCLRCDARLTFHAEKQHLLCHHCGSEQKMIKQCSSCQHQVLNHYGQGTEKIALILSQLFPDVEIIRIDRDSTRKKGSLNKALTDIQSGKCQIMIGTQMLAKGHHFPNVTLVGIIDSDQGLFGSDFRASERLAQLTLQVAGRAGRANLPGLVLIQTHHPHHPLMQLIVKQDYEQIAQALLAERQAAQFPPYCYLALVRAESTSPETALNFLSELVSLSEQQTSEEITLLGPLPAPMEKRAGRYRAHLIISANQRQPLHLWLDQNITLIKQAKTARKVRWSLDIDPQEVI